MVHSMLKVFILAVLKNIKDLRLILLKFKQTVMTIFERTSWTQCGTLLFLSNNTLEKMRDLRRFCLSGTSSSRLLEWSPLSGRLVGTGRCQDPPLSRGEGVQLSVELTIYTKPENWGLISQTFKSPLSKSLVNLEWSPAIFTESF